MPTVGPFHHHFGWDFSDTNAAPVHTSIGGIYPQWQASVIMPSLLGIIGAWIDARWELLKWHWRVAKRLHRLSTESRTVIVKVLDTLESPFYPKAQQAVRKTAHTLGFNDPSQWKELSRTMRASLGHSENTYRHMLACKLLRETAGSTLTNWDQNLMTELAYHGYTFTRK